MEWKSVFQERHACTHSSAMAAEGWLKEEDSFWNKHSEDELRACPQERCNSVVWLLWHMARCEDVAVNAMLRQEEEVLDREHWLPRLGVTTRHIGTGATMAEVVEFSRQVDLAAVRAYRAAVGRATREWVESVPLALLEGCLVSERVGLVVARGDLGENAGWIVKYWTEREWSKVGFLTWLAIEHNFYHFGEARVTCALLGRSGRL